jgi:hypothetical protein
VSGPYVANETGTALALAWTTGRPALGRVTVTSPGGSVRVVPDVRGEGVVSAVHFVTVDRLEPDTEYSIEIEPGGREPLHVRTGPVLGIPESRERWGRLERTDRDAVVLVRVVSADGSKSRYLASLASDGYWSVNLGNLRAANPASFEAVGENTPLELDVLGPLFRRVDADRARRGNRVLDGGLEAR